jgi:hypothetical protein
MAHLMVQFEGLFDCSCGDLGLATVGKLLDEVVTVGRAVGFKAFLNVGTEDAWDKGLAAGLAVGLADGSNLGSQSVLRWI